MEFVTRDPVAPWASKKMIHIIAQYGQTFPPQLELAYIMWEDGIAKSGETLKSYIWQEKQGQASFILHGCLLVVDINEYAQ